MDSKQDYFRSPTPRNLQHFYSPFRLLRPDQDPLLINNSLSPLNRNASSYISQFSPHLNHNQQSQITNKRKFSANEANKIKQILSFEDQQQGQQQQSQQLSTPQKNNQKISHIQTTSKKKYDLRFIETNQKPHIGRDVQKGLRALSKQAFQVFKTANSLTYQQVAQRIIEENDELSQYPEVNMIVEQKKKERQSIKRRVYDALNVLIAVGKLQKVGKKILLNKKMIQQSEKQMGTIKFLSQKYQDKLKQIQTKKKNLQRIRKNKQIIRTLINRNKDLPAVQKDTIINFPFVIAKQPCLLTDVNEVKINGFICGDIDALRFIDFDTKC